jgi:NAD(P)-dependent dehydrogenase (short-subunit alcohol dehydrogenase family)
MRSRWAWRGIWKHSLSDDADDKVAIVGHHGLRKHGAPPRLRSMQTHLDLNPQAGNLRSAVRNRLVKTVFAEPVSLYGKTAIVTGAALGSLGFETARVLASWGATVIVTVRADTGPVVSALKRLLGAETPSIDGHPLDLAHRESVAEFVGWVRSTHPNIDVLVNNAGVHLDLVSRWKEPKLTSDGFETHWRINYLGTAHLTHQLLPVLLGRAQTTGDARVVNVSSHLHERGANADLFGATRKYSSWNAYGNSKLALVHMANELERRHGEAGLRAYSLHPGSVCTNVAARGLEDIPRLMKLRNALIPIESFFLKSPLEGAQTQVHCASRPGLCGGLYYQECEPIAPSEDSENAEVASRLWDTTVDWIEA